MKKIDEAHRFREKVISRLQLYPSDNSITNIFFKADVSFWYFRVELPHLPPQLWNP